LPEISKQLLRINEFSRKVYVDLIASKTRLE